MPRLSLIVATYNRAEQLLTTLWSVAAQTAPAAEWAVSYTHLTLPTHREV